MPHTRIRTFLFTPVSNSRLVAFRMLFGLLMATECFGAVFTGHITALFADSPFNFSFIGFEWLSFLHGAWMNYYYAGMGLLALCMMLGFRYRLSAFLLALFWTLAYLAEKTHYNNHYYLMVLLTWLMALSPTHRQASLDVRQGSVMPADTCPRWLHLLFTGQIWILYTCAAIAKMNPDWLQAMPLRLWMPSHVTTPVIGPLFRPAITPWVMAYSGLLFDLLVVPGLLWRRTRLAAFCASVFFHLSNSIVFGIGTFPYLAIALCIFFASPAWVNRRLQRLRFRTDQEDGSLQPPRWGAAALAGVYLLVQLVLPVRHWFIEGNVNWTEEGHRMAWRMMLRSKTGTMTYQLKDKHTGATWEDHPELLLTHEQFRDLTTHPDVIWQYAQWLKRQHQIRGIDIAVYARGCCSLNGRACVPLVDPQTDLAAVDWAPFRHNSWITLQH